MLHFIFMCAKSRLIWWIALRKLGWISNFHEHKVTAFAEFNSEQPEKLTIMRNHISVPPHRPRIRCKSKVYLQSTSWTWANYIRWMKEEFVIPASSGFVAEQSASFPGRDEDFKTPFCLTNSLALFAARAAWALKQLGMMWSISRTGNTHNCESRLMRCFIQP